MEEIREKLNLAARQVFGEALSDDFLVEVTLAPEGSGADFSSNVAMQLASKVHAAPREVAEKIISELPSNFPFSVSVAGPGFLNFIAFDEYYVTKLADFQDNFEKNISRDEYSGKTVVCEFSDPNPFKVLHVGHLYTSIVGDAMSRLVEFAGGKVIRANFGGDVGLHVAKTLYAVLKNDEDTENIETIAKCYVEGTRAYEEDEKAKAEIVELNKKIYQIAEKGTEFDWDDAEMARLAELYWRGREVSYQYFNDFYARIGVKFDKYYPESMVAKRGLDEVRKHVGEVYEDSDGAVIFPGEKYDLHTRVFINKEGLPTYEAKDVGLIFTKWDDYHFDQSVVITGNDIIDYMKVVLKSISLYAPELVEKTKHITHGNVRLPGNEKMSSRKGNFIRAVDVLDEVSELVPTDFQVALGAIKYAFLKYKVGGNIEFDAKASVSTTGNSGVYLQYSAVRAKKILAAVGNVTGELASGAVLNGYEKTLLRKVFEYKEVLSEAVTELAPHKLANYLFEVSQEFSRFYENVKVAGSEEEAMRTNIVAVYLSVMTHGLNLMGIEVSEEM
ncbi:arginine--tRNA ligase [Candidatus Saccharibacteria bacterium]|nr:arginine--tRNA ligase [Candidatus Saccharibacteria bacterium]